MDQKTPDWQAQVASNIRRSEQIVQLALRCPFPVSQFLPGQFICLAPLSADSVLARPFSVCHVDETENTISLMVKVVGKNTQLLSQLAIGQKIKAWGPLGQGLKVDFNQYKEVWLVAGGIGLAPLYYIANTLSQAKVFTRILIGNKNAAETINFQPGEFANQKLYLTTDDGSFGYKGFVTDLFKQKVMGFKDIMVIACGPRQMLQKIAATCQKHNLDCLVVMETIMACGLRICLGCSIKTTAGMKSVCHDGPIFKAEEVIWQ
jgi:dihydroorotate dehydrogenase electron transfer subunit